MITVSFRAEVDLDVKNFKQLLNKNGVYIAEITAMFDRDIPDVVVEMKIDATFDIVVAISREVENGHVINETLKESLWQDNPMERTYDIQ